ncbi:MAG TPA: hypothetical protein VFS08_03120 [Gemmatimonadaceae bacterium]|nr:hypothetical protein [Gemmatimonadaceae bacterium]
MIVSVRSRRRLASVTLAFVAACRSPITPPEVTQATPMPAQPPYSMWWAATERCSGLRGDFAAIRWASIPNTDRLAADGHSGSWWPVTNQITLAGNVILDGRLVRHEMLHALLGTRHSGQHPYEYFGHRCGGIVACAGPCATDIRSSAPQVPAGASVIGSSTLRVHVEAPDTVRRGTAGGWVMVFVSVQNPLARTAVLQLAASPGASEARGFGYRMGPAGGQELLPAAPIVLAPHGVLRRAFDVRAGLYPAGASVATGLFNDVPGDSAHVVVAP